MTSPSQLQYLNAMGIPVWVSRELVIDEALSKDVAMHVAASNPEVINPEQVPAELVEKEKEIFIAQGFTEIIPLEYIAAQ